MTLRMIERNAPTNPGLSPATLVDRPGQLTSSVDEAAETHAECNFLYQRVKIIS